MELEQAKQDIDFQVRREMTATIEYEREWMKDELEAKAREHENELKKLLIKNLNEDLLSEKACVVETRTTFEQQLCKLKASHVIEINENQKLINKGPRDALDFPLNNISNMVAKQKQRRSNATTTAENHRKFKFQYTRFTQKARESRMESETRHGRCAEKYRQLQKQKDKEIEDLKVRHKADMNKLISSSAERGAHAVRRAVLNAQKDLLD